MNDDARELVERATHVVSEPPPSGRRDATAGRFGWFVAHAPALLLSLAALVTSVQSCRGGESKTDAVYDAIRARVDEQGKQIEQLHADVVANQAWLRGYLQATGVKVTGAGPAADVQIDATPAPGASIAPAVATPPMESKSESAQPVPVEVHVLTPLPNAKALKPAAPLPAHAPEG